MGRGVSFLSKLSNTSTNKGLFLITTIFSSMDLTWISIKETYKRKITINIFSSVCIRNETQNEKTTTKKLKDIEPLEGWSCMSRRRKKNCRRIIR